MERRERDETVGAGYFWPPLICTLVLAPLFILIAIASAGVGHGNYFLAKMLFPYTMLSTIVFDEITAPFLILGIVQFPIYGLILGLMNRRRALVPALIGLSILHLGAAVCALILIGENFS